MYKTLSYITIGILLLFNTQAFAQLDENLYLNATVLDTKDENPLKHVHILNLSSLRGTITNDEGNFTIIYKLGDEIRLSALGFESKIILIDAALLEDENLTFLLSQKAYALDEIVIRPVPKNVAELKRAILDLEIPDTIPDLALRIPDSPAIIDMLNKYGAPAESATTPGQAAGVVIEGPITFLYQNLHPWQRRHKKGVEKMNKILYYRLNMAPMVRRVTGLEELRELDAFMAYCNLDENLIEQLSDYDLAIVISNFYTEYIN